MQFELILLAVLSNYLRKHPRNMDLSPETRRRFKMIMMVAFGLIVVDFIWPSFKPVTSIIGKAALFAICYVALTNKSFSRYKFIIYAFVPFLIINVAEDLTRAISKSLHSRFSDIFDVATTFSIFWLIAMWYTHSRQQKRIEKERLKAEEKEKELQITERLKNELEQLVEARTAELTLQKQELEKTITNLKSTQEQLIHAEKMASLGELTAGIAHEIQNPLNFVNNFAELNLDLIEEIETELRAGNPLEAIAIVGDLKTNNEKIAHHGKRADSIVKGMLQHSRKSNGTKEPADINALLDECMRLSYHGIRARDKSFNANFKLNLDPGMGKINVEAQDMGRVFLNLFNNAFYAVSEKKAEHPVDFEPLVTVSSVKEPGKAIITITDNGNGIPAAVRDKIFQPFFTTKPTGKGTGLGLSISYDIIVKGHSGKIAIESAENEYTSFIIELPV